MKKRLLLFTLLVFLSIFTVSYADTSQDENKDDEFKGVWVASVLNIDYPRHATTNPALLKIEADNIIESASNQGFNAIFLQVRPTADSLYKSKIFPWSKYLTGKEGLAPDNGFDPLEYFITEAHKKNIEVHAWINPYRITKRKSGEAPYTVDMLSENHPARKYPQYVISHNGDLYFDPALFGVRWLITLGVMEIVNNYDVDGIHFDDYFYPSTEFNDEKSYKKYGRGKDIGDWRRENVNKLVRQVYRAVHRSKKDVVFGISPFGIWANDNSIARGSKTRGGQSYFSHYADSLYWINNSIIDYIAPQIYWHKGKEVADFNVLTDWWANAVKNKKTKLYIGLAAYKADSSDENSPWYRNYELKRQLNYIENKEDVDGYIAFNITSLRDSNRAYNAFRGKGDIRTIDGNTNKGIKLYGYYDYQYVGGLLDPKNEAYLNGAKIKDVSDKGFFGILVDNRDDNNNGYEKNVFVLNQVGVYDKVIKEKPSPWYPSDEKEKPVYKNAYLNNMLKSGVSIFVKIKDDETNLRVDKNPREGSMELLDKGMLEEVDEFMDDMVKLTSNRYIEQEYVDIEYSPSIKIENATYKDYDERTEIVFSSKLRPVLTPYIDGENLILSASDDITLPEIKIPNYSFIKSYKIENRGNRNVYVFKLKDMKDLGGYHYGLKNNKLVFTINHKKYISNGDKPLKGFDIVLDAGHGEKDSGALGLLGRSYAEKDVNLDVTLKLGKKLKELGAEVILTRESDIDVTLHERLLMVFKHNPDMFISVHANSCLLNKDVNDVDGFSVFYSKDVSKGFAELAQIELSANTACTDNSLRFDNFYVIRATNCPSVLLELGFMPNPEDFDWLCDDTKQDEFVSELARVILLYFEK